MNGAAWVEALKIREHNENEPQVAGFFWPQPIQARIEIRRAVLLGLSFPLMVTAPLGFELTRRFGVQNLDAFSLAFVLSALACMAGIGFAFSPPVTGRLSELAGLRFGSNDVIEVLLRTKGLSAPRFSRSWVRLDCPVSAIRTIEMQRTGEFFEGGRYGEYMIYRVAVFLDDGTAFSVTSCISNFQARIVTEQLNQALGIIRRVGFEQSCPSAAVRR